MATYKTPIVALLEYGLVAAILFHALNGLRIIAVDFWAKGPRLQKQMLWTVLGIWIVRDGRGPVPRPRSRRTRRLRELRPMSSETSSAAAIGDVEGVSLYDVDNPAPVIEPPRKRTAKTPKASRGNFEMYAWLFMRLSGILLTVLVIGHLLIQLVLDGGVSRSASPSWRAAGPRRSGRPGT